MPSVADLKQRLARMLKARNLEAALGALTALAKKEPEDPSWPRRAARIMHATADFEGEIAALRRALELQIEQSQVLDAIASCRAILDLRPDDAQTLETLDLLYLSGESPSGSTPIPGASPNPEAGGVGRGATLDAPLDSMRLSDVVPGSQSVQFADAKPGGVSEIPLEGSELAPEDEIPDLRLDVYEVPSSPQDLAAAQAASLPSSSGKRRSKASGVDRGASLRQELAKIPLFGDVDARSLKILIQDMRVVMLEAGDVLFRQGDAADSLYVVVSGAVVPIAEGTNRRKLAVLEKGEFFGEIGLITKQPRNATIEALVDAKLLAIDRRLVRKLIDSNPSVAKSLVRFLRIRMIDRQIRTNLFFAAFAHAERESVARQFRMFEVEDGACVVEQGRLAEGLFVVLSGSLVRIDRERGKEVGVLELGDVFGAPSLLDGRSAGADVVARGKCWLLVLGAGRFRRILDANPRLARALRGLAADASRPDSLPEVGAP